MLGLTMSNYIEGKNPPLKDILEKYVGVAN